MKLSNYKHASYVNLYMYIFFVTDDQWYSLVKKTIPNNVRYDYVMFQEKK